MQLGKRPPSQQLNSLLQERSLVGNWYVHHTGKCRRYAREGFIFPHSRILYGHNGRIILQNLRKLFSPTE